MHVNEFFFNKSEERVSDELEEIAAQNGLRVRAKVRLSDVISKGKTVLTRREFDFYTRSHCDFLITDRRHRPRFIVEYDGPLHHSDIQKWRDQIKNDLCQRAGIGLLRINDKHVTRTYRGMTVLRWIIEVSELEKQFYEAQSKGQIPWDEPFDPAFVDTGAEKRFPYWLSAEAIDMFHSFFATLDRKTPKGWSGLIGSDEEGKLYRLSYLYFGGNIIWTKCAIRRQNFEFPESDLLAEIDVCELGLRLAEFRRGNINAISTQEFRGVAERFCTRYNATPSFFVGNGSPVNTSWDFERGWDWR
ncbi:DUF2726 domain-containing protein [Salinarimonas ramus]|nr:DUF2726 domain-containing protein [Salinarimonas ramus]